MSVDTLTASYTSATFADKNAGTKTVTVSGITISGTDAANYILKNEDASATTIATINAKSLSIENATATSRDYDGTKVVDIAGTLKDAFSTDDVSLTGKGTLASKNVGSQNVISIGLAGADAGNYTLTPPSNLTATISAKTLTLKDAVVKEREYDGTKEAEITGNLDGIISPDEVMLGKAVLASKNADTHAVTSIGLTGTNAGNYILEIPEGLTGKINPKQLTVSAEGKDKTYDGNTSATVTLTTSKITGDKVEANYTSASFEDKKAGTGKNVKVEGITLVGDDIHNYSVSEALSVPVTTTASINKKELIIEGAKAVTKEYDRNNIAAITGDLAGKVDGDNVTLSTSGTFATINVEAGIMVTSTSIITGADKDNYFLTQPTGLTADITSKELTVNGAIADTKEYDGNTNATINGTLMGVLPEDVVTLKGTGTFATPNVGKDIPITSTSTLTGTSARNYFLKHPTDLFSEITAKKLTIENAGASTREYDGTNVATITGTLNGVVNNENVTLNRTGTFAIKDVGTDIAVTSTSTLGGTAARNYILTQPTGLKASITQRRLTVTDVKAVNKTYDMNAAATFSGSLDRVVDGDVVTWSGSGSFTPSGTGNKFAADEVYRAPDGTVLDKDVIFSTSTLQGKDAGNYFFAPITITRGTAKIEPKVLEPIIGTTITKEYDGTSLITLVAGGLKGVISPDHVSLYINSATTLTVGTHESVTVALSIGSTDKDNYDLQPKTATITITVTKRPLTIAAQGIEKVYDGNTNAEVNMFVKSISDTDKIVTGDDVTIVYNSAKFVDKNVGNRDITVEGITLRGTAANNYSFNQTTSTSAIIKPKGLTISGVSANSKTYDRTTNASVSNTQRPALNGVVDGETVSLNASNATAFFSSKTAGIGKTVTVTGYQLGTEDAAKNYTLAQPTGVTADIFPLTIKGTVKIAEKIYDGNTTAIISDRSLEGVITNDLVSYVGGTATFDNKNVGEGKTVNVSGLDITGADAVNYTVNNTATSTAKINPKELIGSFKADDKYYDGSPNATVTTDSRRVTGMIGDEVVILEGGTATFEDAKPGTDKLVTLTGATISGPNHSNYKLAATPITTTATIEQPLPVTLISFTAKAQKGAVTLDWATATEKDNEYFQVERSQDGKNFSPIGKVKGNGNSNVRIDYSFLDSKLATGTLYYRLKQVDVDGKFEYSKTVAVQNKVVSSSNVSIAAYPNPTSDALNLDLTQTTASDVKIGVYSLDGRLVKTATVTGGKVQKLDLSKMMAGTYLVKMIGEDFETIIRVVKQ
ncbi:hypothetical protein DC20_10945 [Rufibacter tibetensis]|uniref:Secretion system C-terminal sorting domain-containing protein n=1 Tax=Rufibacter tibetensis TaxID=512763 RepID=A0A0P0CSB1_9BACT|nr:hypothetical protein DC20_10945 [Rufibacter tibetensis]